jgi:phage/plasmid-like protein (TIGR03299 family)
MSHQIFELDNPFYGSRNPAWHNLGTVLDGQLTSAEALVQAGLDWLVDLESLQSTDGIVVPDAFVTCRLDLACDDKRRFLGVVGTRYNPIQNSEAFRLADALIGEGGARFETAGSLKNGRIVWMLAELPESQKIVDDTLKSYLLLRTSHDGTASLECLLTSIRVVCHNTLTAALRATKNRVKVRHTASAKVNIDEARRILGLAKDHFEEHANRLNQLAAVKVDDRFAKAFSAALYPDAENRNNTRAQNARRDILGLFHGGQAGANQEATNGTAYGLLNAMTEYLDHRTSPERTTKTRREVAENRFASTLWGNHAAKRQQAFDLLSRATGVDGQGRGIMEQVLEARPTADSSDSGNVDDLLGALDLG